MGILTAFPDARSLKLVFLVAFSVEPVDNVARDVYACAQPGPAQPHARELGTEVRGQPQFVRLYSCVFVAHCLCVVAKLVYVV